MIPQAFTKASSLSVRPGFFRADDCAILELKWTPFFFNSRNCSNFLLVSGGGNPGGEGENGATAGVGVQDGDDAVEYSTREPGSVTPGTQIVCTTAVGGNCVRNDYAE